MPASALFGAAFLMACDAVARVVLVARRAAGGRRDRGAGGAILPVAADTETMNRAPGSGTREPAVPRPPRSRTADRDRLSRTVAARCPAGRPTPLARSTGWDSPSLLGSDRVGDVRCHRRSAAARAGRRMPATRGSEGHRRRQGPARGVARAGGHRDAVRRRRRSAGGRRQQLRQDARRGRDAAARRRAARSRPRTHPVAEAGSRRDLRIAGRRCTSSSHAPGIATFTYRHGGIGDTLDDDGSDRRAHGPRRRRTRGGAGAARAADRRPDARGRASTPEGAARVRARAGHASATSGRAAARASCTNCSTWRAPTTSLPTSIARTCRPRANCCWPARPRSSSNCRPRRARQNRRRRGWHCPACPP